MKQRVLLKAISIGWDPVSGIWGMICAVGLLGLNLVFGTVQNGAANWISVGGISIQPSEIAKILYIFVGAGTLDSIMTRRNKIEFIIFSAICVGELALMGDFGTALIFFATFLFVAFMRSGDIVSSDNWFAFQGPRGEAPISGWAFIEPTEKIRNLFSKRGEAVRAETTFLMTDATTRDGDYIPVAQPGEPTAYNGKAYTPANQMTPGRTGYGDNNNIRVFRYADVLLMNAEAKVRKGQNGDAPLNLVRERAGLAPIANATLDQILEERQVELALEWGERFFDLVRTDRATQELPGFVKGESEYYPIPQDQIDLNPNLEAEPVPFEPEVTE